MIIRRSLPYLADSSRYFARIRPLGYPVLLDSCQPAAPMGRYDILSAAPVELIRYRQGQDSGCPFDRLQQLLDRYAVECQPQPELPFCGGLIGHFGYDLGRSIEHLPQLAVNDMAYPDMQVGLYLWALIVDHQTERCELVMQPTMADADQQRVLDALEGNEPDDGSGFQLTAPFRANVSADQYRQRLQRIDDYIHAGDCYQVNFAQRFTAGFSGDPWQAYLKLRQQAPTPFAAYLESPEGAVLSLSPERFLELDGQNVVTKPIKGTRPRAADPAEDQALADELLGSSKDRAENLMIVDLLRNDLSKACRFGSVKVPKLFALESYANVHHLVSTVTGELDKDSSALALLRSCFPGGSITGAPKLRAMEIIEELEPHRRNIYCGSIGYVSFCGRMDTSICIRTLLAEQGKIHCWAGGGIVADSEIDLEYQETFNKVNNLLKTLEATL
ncbi:aminodeoxychorismate synthase component I [Marinobacterium arenosum]|uniref:aminodeoxychorismate synthase component I n=1 Tax=Marinobacterium arenosum TaxID=2862496 RepID=UPI001C97D01E|nr:aminodeoxychorismate synthase component I [Marinobacterium arenosum]MBY4675240.1 aminodeoxychorismate synthase component I [Marinobacterium arenosum]